MKLKILKLIILSLCIGLVQLSCRTEKDSPIIPTITNPISVNEARSWYEGKALKRARTSVKSLSNRMTYWDAAQTTKLSNGTPVIIVPLFYNYKNPVILSPDALVSDGKDKNPKLLQSTDDLKITKKMIIAKDDQGGYQSCVMIIGNYLGSPLEVSPEHVG